MSVIPSSPFLSRLSCLVTEYPFLYYPAADGAGDRGTLAAGRPDGWARKDSMMKSHRVILIPTFTYIHTCQLAYQLEPKYLLAHLLLAPFSVPYGGALLTYRVRRHSTRYMRELHTQARNDEKRGREFWGRGGESGAVAHGLRAMEHGYLNIHVVDDRSQSASPLRGGSSTEYYCLVDRCLCKVE